MKVLLIVLDGVADRPCKMLGNKTPLEAAKKNNIDSLAKNGLLYSMNVIDEKTAPESDQGTLAILGYDIEKVYTGRGPLEAYGDGIKFDKNSVVVRCNFASVFGGKIHHNRVKDIEAMPTREEIKLVEGIKMKNVKFKSTVGYRGVLIINKKLSPRVTNSHPGYSVTKNFMTTALPVKNRLLTEKKVLPLEKNAKEIAGIINEFIKQAKSLLKNKTILTRGSGSALPQLKKMKNWAILADMPVEKAIGNLAGMKVVEKPADLKKLGLIVKKQIQTKNVYIQIKEPDSFAHKGDAIGKKKAIEKIDKDFIGRIKGLKNTIIVITADHATPCSLMAHSNDAVPALIYGLGMGNASEFSEREAMRIGKRIHGRDLLKMMAP